MSFLPPVSSIITAIGVTASTALGTGSLVVAANNKNIKKIVVVENPVTPQELRELRCVPRNYKMGYEEDSTEDNSPKLTYDCFFVSNKYQYFNLKPDGTTDGDDLE